MSYAELKAHTLYETMNLDAVSEDVKRQLIILILTKSSTSAQEAIEADLPNPISLEDALSQGCIDLETARQQLHGYVDTLAREYSLQ